MKMKGKLFSSMLVGSLVAGVLGGMSAYAALSYQDPPKLTGKATSWMGVTTLTLWVDGKFSYDGKTGAVVKNEGNYSKTLWAGTLNIRDFVNGKYWDQEYKWAEVHSKLVAEAGMQVSGVGWVWDTKNFGVYQSCSKDGVLMGYATGF